MEKILLNSNRNLEGRLWLRKDSKKAIVIAHSFRNTMNEPACSEAERKFAEEGYNVLSFNFRGHGNSEGRLRELSYKTVSEDISLAIRYMKEKGLEKVGVYAISLGTIASVLSSERVDAQVFLSATPLYYTKGLLERYASSIDEEQLEKNGYCLAISGSGRGSFEIGKTWIDEMKAENGEVLETHLKRKIPTLLIQGTGDIEGIKKSRRFTKLSPDAYLEVDGADHNFTNEKDRQLVIDKALDWFKKYLS